MFLFNWLGFVFATILCLVVWRILRGGGIRARKRSRDAQNVALIVLGSGGHTMEMFKLMHGICRRFNKRVYVTTDELSKQKVRNVFYGIDLSCFVQF